MIRTPVHLSCLLEGTAEDRKGSMWDMSICKHGFRAVDFDLPYSVSDYGKIAQIVVVASEKEAD